MRVSLRTKIMAALLAAVLLTVALAAWAVNDRIESGARREAENQAQSQTAQVRALYDERAATLAAEGEAVSLYPAVIAAIADGNATPLLDWSSAVFSRQHTGVTVVDRNGRVVARGHDPERRGDLLLSQLQGLQMALDGNIVSGTEDGDELGLALRGYAPVTRNGEVVGAVMIADPLDERLSLRLSGDAAAGTVVSVEPANVSAEGCHAPNGNGPAACFFTVPSPSAQPAATVRLSVPLAEIQAARDDAQRALWIVGAVALVAGAAAAWLLARSLSAPLARLTHSAERIGRAEYDQPVGINRSDEIGTLARALDSMREQVAAASAALRDERDVLNAVLEATEEGILLTNAEGTTRIMNARWQELTGGDGLNAAGTLERSGGGSGFFDDAWREWLAEPDRVARADFERFEPYVRFRCYSAPVRTPNGHGRIFTLRDVTRESEAERMRTALVSTVSHELRSPLTAIKGYVDSLLDGGPWDEATEREFLDIIAASAEKLAVLVDNLLDAAKLEAGVLRMEMEPVRVERIAQQVLDHRRRLAPSHELRLEVDDNLPLAEADPIRLEQILVNLVDNAIKYSPAGGPVTVRITGGDSITVRVSDQGVGIAQEDADRLFERFFRVDNGLARSTKGVGLGLYICKSLIEGHGGRIWVESAPGRGSTFAFTLPRPANTDRVARPGHRQEPDAAERLTPEPAL
jgi:two-component system phosphate regulon sensor histidine kinase PhoR